MRVVLPVAIDDTTFVSSTVPEADYPTWSAATSYTTGQKVIRGHKCWESINPAANLNHFPETSPLWWLDLGATNQWAAFDDKVGTQSVGGTPMVLVFRPGQIDTVALLDVDAETVNVTVRGTPGGAVVYDSTQGFLAGDVIDDWWLYYFAPFRRRTVGVFTGIPPYGTCEVTVTLSNAISDVKLGTLILGTSTRIGDSQWGARVGINDSSRKESDAFGNVMVVKRPYSKRMSVEVVVNTDFVDEVSLLLAENRATPLLWIGSERFASLVVYGFYKSFEQNIAYDPKSYCSLEIEGLT